MSSKYKQKQPKARTKQMSTAKEMSLRIQNEQTNQLVCLSCGATRHSFFSSNQCSCGGVFDQVNKR